MIGDDPRKAGRLATRATVWCGLALLLSSIPWLAVLLLGALRSKAAVFLVGVFSSGSAPFVAGVALAYAMRIPFARTSASKTTGPWAGVALSAAVAIGIPAFGVSLLRESYSAFWYLPYGLFLPAGLVIAAHLLLLFHAPVRDGRQRASIALVLAAVPGVTAMPFFLWSIWYRPGDYLLAMGSFVMVAGVSDLLSAHLNRSPRAGGGGNAVAPS